MSFPKSNEDSVSGMPGTYGKDCSCTECDKPRDGRTGPLEGVAFILSEIESHCPSLVKDLGGRLDLTKNSVHELVTLMRKLVEE